MARHVGNHRVEVARCSSHCTTSRNSSAPQSALLGVELRQGGRSIYYADAPPYRFTAPIVPKVEYEIAVTGSPDSTADLTVYGLLENHAR